MSRVSPKREFVTNAFTRLKWEMGFWGWNVQDVGSKVNLRSYQNICYVCARLWAQRETWESIRTSAMYVQAVGTKGNLRKYQNICYVCAGCGHKGKLEKLSEHLLCMCRLWAQRETWESIRTSAMYVQAVGTKGNLRNYQNICYVCAGCGHKGKLEKLSEHLLCMCRLWAQRETWEIIRTSAMYVQAVGTKGNLRKYQNICYVCAGCGHKGKLEKLSEHLLCMCRLWAQRETWEIIRTSAMYVQAVGTKGNLRNYQNICYVCAGCGHKGKLEKLSEHLLCMCRLWAQRETWEIIRTSAMYVQAVGTKGNLRKYQNICYVCAGCGHKGKLEKVSEHLLCMCRLWAQRETWEIIRTSAMYVQAVGTKGNLRNYQNICYVCAGCGHKGKLEKVSEHLLCMCRLWAQRETWESIRTSAMYVQAVGTKGNLRKYQNICYVCAGCGHKGKLEKLSEHLLCMCRLWAQRETWESIRTSAMYVQAVGTKVNLRKYQNICYVCAGCGHKGKLEKVSEHLLCMCRLWAQRETWEIIRTSAKKWNVVCNTSLV